jgi:hypothetical protein
MPAKGQPGPKHSPETRKIISEKLKKAYAPGNCVHWSKKYSEFPFMTGFTGEHTEETKTKISQNRTGKGKGNTNGFSPGQEPHNKGKPHPVHTAEWRKAVSAANSGENHWNWKGGITSENREQRNSTQRKEWTRNVFCRDHWTCQSCGHHGQKKDMIAHHIVPWSKSKELRFDVSNGVTLCRACHCELHKPRPGTGKSSKPQSS